MTAILKRQAAIVVAGAALLTPGCATREGEGHLRWCGAGATEVTQVNIDELCNYSDPEGSEGRFRAALVSVKDESTRLELLTQIARAQGLQHKFLEAHRTLDGVNQRLDVAEARVKVRYLLERGRVHNSSNGKEMARPNFLEAWRIAQEIGEDKLAVDAAHMMGIIESADEAIAWNERAMRLAETSNDPATRKWLGPLYHNLGWTYHDAGNYPRAMELFKKALTWNEVHGNSNTIRIAKWTVARALRSLGQVEEAYARQQALLKEYEQLGLRDGYMFEELGECALLLDQKDQAKRYFRTAYGELSKDQWIMSNEPQRIVRLKALADD